jgi:uncharacterized protein YceH (UPF0502 family)
MVASGAAAGESLDRAPEWTAYLADPTPQTLAALVTAADKRDQAAAALRDKSTWKLAQHLSQLSARAGHLTYAQVFAHRAIALSDGDPFARVSLAEALWMRRLPDAVLTQVQIIRGQARRVEEPQRRELLRRGIADLAVRAFAYGGNTRRCGGWVRRLERQGGTREAWLHLLRGARSTGDTASSWVAATALAPHEAAFGGRVRAAIRAALLQKLVAVLRARP